MTSATFASDPVVWAQQKRNQWAFLLFLLLPVFGCLLFSPFALDPLSRGLTAAAILTYLIAAWFLRPNQKKHAFDPLREPRVSVANDHLAYVRENSTVTLTFNDLKRLIIRQNHTGAVYKIEVQTAQQTIALDGFQEMDQLAAAVVSHAPSTCQIRYRRNWFSVFYPWRWWLLTALFVGLFIWWQMMVYSEPWLITAPFSLYILYQFFKSYSLKGKLVLGAIIVLLNLADIAEWIDNEGWNAAALWRQPCSLVYRITRPGLCLRAIEDAEYLYFYGADDNLTKLDWSRIALFPTNNWIGFWTPVLSHDRPVDYFLPSVDRRALVSTTTTARGTTFWVWQSERDVPFGPFAFSDLISKRAVSLAPGGNQIAIADDEGTHLLDVGTGQSINLTDKNLAPLTFDVDGQYLFGINENEQPVMWNILEQIEVTVFPLPDDFEAFGAQAITLSADGRWLAVVYRRSVVVWEVLWEIQAVGIWRQFTIPGAADLVFSDVIALTPDGDYLATSVSHLDGEDNYLFLWHMESSDLFTTLYLGPTSSSFAQTLDISATGELLAVGTESAGYVLAVDKLLGK